MRAVDAALTEKKTPFPTSRPPTSGELPSIRSTSIYAIRIPQPSPSSRQGIGNADLSQNAPCSIAHTSSLTIRMESPLKISTNFAPAGCTHRVPKYLFSVGPEIPREKPEIPRQTWRPAHMVITSLLLAQYIPDGESNRSIFMPRVYCLCVE